MNDDEEERPAEDLPRAAGEMSEREIDRTLAETFPASDPPSWTLGTDHAASSDDEPPED